eukprot:7897975-Lingulodinium_polyedra.AAC.1
MSCRALSRSAPSRVEPFAGHLPAGKGKRRGSTGTRTSCVVPAPRSQSLTGQCGLVRALSSTSQR